MNRLSKPCSPRKRRCAGASDEAIADRERLLARLAAEDPRVAKIAHGKMLAADPDYPQPEIVQSIADLMARNLQT